MPVSSGSTGYLTLTPISQTEMYCSSRVAYNAAITGICNLAAFLSHFNKGGSLQISAFIALLDGNFACEIF